MPRFSRIFFTIGTLALVALMLAILLGATTPAPGTEGSSTTNTQPAATAIAVFPASTSTISAPAARAMPPAPMPTVRTAPSSVPTAQATSSDEAVRIQDPYSTPPEPFAAINDTARAALINILCMPRSGGSLKPISGSGVIIDPRGVILTNAHVAQYVLLSEDPQVNLSCYIRTGAPAEAQYSAQVLYFPTIWAQAHAAEITTVHPTGTGEHDYALLLITNTTDGSPLPATFPYLPYDTREAVAFTGDSVLVASYPAEFLGGVAAEYDLFPASSVTTVGQLITLNTNTVDLLSLGGVIEAQSGSSGGAVVNAWGKLVGLIVTTSTGTTTATRDLRALTLSYIDRDLSAQTGSGLNSLLAGNIGSEAADFTTNTAPSLINLFLTQLAK